VQSFAAQAVIAIENTRLLNELRQRTDDLTEALEQQTATSEVLNVINTSPTDTQPVFDAIIQSAVRLCGAQFGVMHRFDGERLQVVAHDVTPEVLEIFEAVPILCARSARRRQGARCSTGRWSRFGDVGEDPDYDHAMAAAGHWRSLLAVPDAASGRRRNRYHRCPAQRTGRVRVQPLSKCCRTSPAQAVIAIENTRLLNELRESLQQQTATSDVLKVISRSTFDLSNGARYPR